MTFGSFVKGKRLEKKIGLRAFAEMIGEDAGNWCRIENGKCLSPSDIKILNKICQTLEIKNQGREKIFDLAAKDSKDKIPADIKKQIEESEIVPILFRTIDKKKLSKNQLEELIKRIRNAN